MLFKRTLLTFVERINILNTETQRHRVLYIKKINICDTPLQLIGQNADKNIILNIILCASVSLCSTNRTLLMDRTTIESTMFPDCPIRNILARISDKWSLLVIYTLDRAEKEKMRFKELQRKIPDISQNTRYLAKNADRNPPHLRRRRLFDPHGLSRSASPCGIHVDTPRPLLDSAYQRIDRMGIRESGCHLE